MRQWAVNDLAIPASMNADFNRCKACTQAWEDTGQATAVCGHHYEQLCNYAVEMGAPIPPMQRKTLRTEWTLDCSKARD